MAASPFFSAGSGGAPQDRQRFYRYLGAGTYSRFEARARRGESRTEDTHAWRTRLVLVALLLLAATAWGVWRELHG